MKPNIDPNAKSPYVVWAWERNRDPILHALKPLFPSAGDVLELASGTGSHINYFAPHFPGISFQPSDADADVFGAIRANTSVCGNGNVRDPLLIDLTKPETWPSAADRLYDAIFAINCFHVAPPAARDGFAHIAARVLKPEGVAAVYGPFKLDGRYTSPSNEAFDARIRETLPGWSLKDVRDLESAARQRGVALERLLDMPANNFMLVFRKL
jgi:cyclopropane fatty-acyl-phospholipid synthase-like methyltransferase